MNRQSSSPVGCPNAAELSTFFEGTLDAAQRAGLVLHLADCEECRAVLGALGRLTSELPVVPPGLLDAATDRPTRSRGGRVAAVVAAAACVLFAVSIARQAPEQSAIQSATPAAAGSEQPDDVRARTAGAAPELREPKVGAMLSSATRFEWTPVAGAVQYQLHVLTGDGDVVFDATTAATTIEYGGREEQQGPFYAWVSAQLTDGRRVQSAVVRLAGPSR